MLFRMIKKLEKIVKMIKKINKIFTIMGKMVTLVYPGRLYSSEFTRQH